MGRLPALCGRCTAGGRSVHLIGLPRSPLFSLAEGARRGASPLQQRGRVVGWQGRAEGHGSRTHQTRLAHLTGFEDRALHRETRPFQV